jgi:penicillin amidase
VRCRTYVIGLIGSSSENATCGGVPVAQADVQVQRVPEYGPVTGVVNVGGEPHAVVKARGHWMQEVANGKPFFAFSRATTMEEFRAAHRDFTISLNVNYVDDRGNAGFWHVAKPPVRARGTDVRLPTLGDGRFDWQGVVPLDDIPHVINPEQGFTANWNNQVGQGWHNGDQNFWGDLQRVEMLSRRIEPLVRRGNVRPEDIWQVNRQAAFEDGRWHDFTPLLERAYGSPPEHRSPALDTSVAEALETVAAWNGQRTAVQSEDGTWRYDDPATTIFDAWVQQLQRRVLADDLGDAYYDGERRLGATFAPGHYHLYSTLLLKILLGKQAPLQAEHDWLNGGDRDELVRQSFAAAVAEVDERFEGGPATWRGPAVLTTYQPLGLLSVAAHPFMNRGTYNQLAVVDVVGQHVPAAPRTQSPATVPAPAVASKMLPATGAGSALQTGAALLLAFGTSLGGLRRRRTA